MPTTDAIFDAAAADIVALGARDATYLPNAGGSVSLRVFYQVEVEMQPDGHMGTAWAEQQTVQGLLSDFGQEPDQGDTIEIDQPAGTKTYTIARVLENDGRWVKLAVKEA